MDPLGRGDAADPAHLAWLRAAGAARVRHSRRTLLDHLLGTRDLLAAWGARRAVCDAGLFHSVYGTVALRKRLLQPTRRKVIRKLIGDEAERRVWLFHAIDRGGLRALAAAGRLDALWVAGRRGARLDLAPGELDDLANLLAGNALEQFAYRSAVDHARALGLLPLREHLLPAAVAALERLGSGARSQAPPPR